MKRYMLILFEDQSLYNEFSPEEMQKEIEIHMKWVESLGDRFEGGEPLEHAAQTIRGKDTLVTDGPFTESKEVVSGYYILKAENLEQATELSKGCPVLRLGGKVEVREIMVM